MPHLERVVCPARRPDLFIHFGQSDIAQTKEKAKLEQYLLLARAVVRLFCPGELLDDAPIPFDRLIRKLTR